MAVADDDVAADEVAVEEVVVGVTKFSLTLLLFIDEVVDIAVVGIVLLLRFIISLFIGSCLDFSLQLGGFVAAAAANAADVVVIFVAVVVVVVVVSFAAGAIDFCVSFVFVLSLILLSLSFARFACSKLAALWAFEIL